MGKDFLILHSQEKDRENLTRAIQELNPEAQRIIAVATEATAFLLLKERSFDTFITDSDLKIKVISLIYHARNMGVSHLAIATMLDKADLESVLKNEGAVVFNIDRLDEAGSDRETFREFVNRSTSY